MALIAVQSYAMASPGADSGIHCAECGMAVNTDGPFASHLEYPGGKTEWFCDLGDMMLYYYGDKDKAGAAKLQVKDYPSNSWMDGRKAWYLTGTGVKTPMRYGIIAFRDKKAAEEFKAKSGGNRVVGFDDAISLRVFEE
jgi:copper chaperone NosL